MRSSVSDNSDKEPLYDSLCCKIQNWNKNMVEKIKIDIQKKLKKIKNLVKDVVEIEKKDNIYPDQMNELFGLVEWFVDNNVSNKIYYLLKDLNDEEIEIIDYLIKETVYRLEFSNDKGDMSTLTPFAIPFVASTRGIYTNEFEFVKSIPNTVDALSSERLIRKGLDLGEEPDIAIDNRLWRMDLKEWNDHNAVIDYLKSALECLLQKKTFRPLSKIKTKKINIENPEDTLYVMFKSVVGFVISSDDMIDDKIFENEENKDNNLMNEFAVMCEKEFQSMGFKDACVCAMSRCPIELFEVPLLADEFSLGVDAVIEELKMKGDNI